MQDATHHFMSVWFVGGLLCAAFNDAWRMRIPNGLVLGLLAGYAVAIALSQPPLAEIAANAAAAAATFAGGMVLFTRGWMGGGDVKLLAVAALWLGAAATPALLLLTAMAGGVVTVALIACRAFGAHRFQNGQIAALSDPKGRVPYGIAIAAASIAVALLRPSALPLG